MDEKTVLLLQQLLKPIKILKWKVAECTSVSIGSVILLYDFDGVRKSEQRKLKSTQAGTVFKILAPEGAIVKPGEPLLKLWSCIHPTVMKDMCAECGADLRKDDVTTTASVPMVHAIPELKVSEETAQKLGKADGDRLLRDRKLVLLVDLDQTLIHTTNDNIPPNIKDVYHFQLYGPNTQWFHTRLRPGTHEFLSNISPLFELHICTFGARNYAHTITMFLDGDQTFFSNRILSRDECFDPTSKKANLKALFPCGDNMVCIIDDREDVWSHALNLIHVKPYHFFQHTGDINAPPGLDKQENDDKGCVDLTKVKKKSDKLNGKKVNEHNGTEVAKVNGQKEDKVEDAVVEVAATNKEESTDLQTVNSNNTEETVTEQTVTEQTDTEQTVTEQTVTEQTVTEQTKDKEDLIEIEDPDDYLLHLEDILRRIHKKFYEEYDKLESGEVPDLKQVIPNVRSQVLHGTKLVFSGLVPTHIKLEQSKAYQVARSLGASVTQDLDDGTTHLVAVRPGTAKVNAGRRRKNLKIVTTDWLWSCAERWEHVEEAIYPLNRKGSKNRHPPPHCSSPQHVPCYPAHDTPAVRKRTPSGRFMDTINPLMSFSSDDIADMDKEVEDILDDESDDSDEEKAKPSQKPEVAPILQRQDDEESSSSSAESLTGEYPRGFKRTREKQERELKTEEDYVESSLDEYPSAKFRRGEQLDSDLDIGQESNSEGSAEAPDEVDDGDWNMMGAALEREFLSNN